MKTCTKCKRELAFAEFHKRTISKDGLAYTCKTCYAAYHVEYAKKNRPKLAARLKEWWRKNPEKGKASQSEYRRENALKIKAQHAEWYKKNYAEHNAKTARWRNDNPEYRLQELLSERYVKRLICKNTENLKVSDISKELLELKRAHLEIMRTLRQLNATIKEKQNGTK